MKTLRMKQKLKNVAGGSYLAPESLRQDESGAEFFVFIKLINDSLDLGSKETRRINH